VGSMTVDPEWVRAAVHYCSDRLLQEVECRSVNAAEAPPGRVLKRKAGAFPMVLHTNLGAFRFFVRRQHAGSSWMMTGELRRVGAFCGPILHLPDVILLQKKRPAVALVPAVMEKDRPGLPLVERLAAATPEERGVLARHAALVIREFDRLLPARVDVELECHDILAVRHASTSPLPLSVAAQIRDWIVRWQSFMERERTGFTPRDYWTNLLVGVPLFQTGRPLSLSLVDIGESYKPASAGERLAQALIMCKYEVAWSTSDKQSWMMELTEACVEREVDLTSVRLYLGLWGIRRRLWQSSSTTDLSEPCELIRTVRPTKTPEAAVEACLELA